MACGGSPAAFGCWPGTFPDQLCQCAPPSSLEPLWTLGQACVKQGQLSECLAPRLHVWSSGEKEVQMVVCSRPLVGILTLGLHGLSEPPNLMWTKHRQCAALPSWKHIIFSLSYPMSLSACPSLMSYVFCKCRVDKHFLANSYQPTKE